MLLVMKTGATAEETAAVCREMEEAGVRTRVIHGRERTLITLGATLDPAETLRIEALNGVAEILNIRQPFKLASREAQADNTQIPFPGSGLTLGGSELAIVILPCPAHALTLDQARHLYAAGARFLLLASSSQTGPQSDFNQEQLAGFDRIRKMTGLKLILEAFDLPSLTQASELADMVLIGSRNMQNFSLLKEAGQQMRPVLLERGLSATLEEMLMAAEYLLSEGNFQVALCETGVRSFTSHTSNTLDLSLLPMISAVSHLPVLTAPGIATSQSQSTPALARASVAAGAAGVVLELATTEDLSQALPYETLHALLGDLNQIAHVVGRTLPSGTQEEKQEK